LEEPDAVYNMWSRRGNNSLHDRTMAILGDLVAQYEKLEELGTELEALYEESKLNQGLDVDLDISKSDEETWELLQMRWAIECTMELL
jgi:hypothetical protein